ncbi:MAG: glycosyltransferase, partial [Bacteroidetes bacterium]|nr:glycosyltransferase [Bacteroidota bacterium]
SGLAHPKTFVVPNVVNIALFVPPQSKPATGKAVILHVSCFEDKSKNITAFLDAMAVLFKRGKDFNVLLVGEGPDQLALSDYAGKLGLRNPQTEFAGLKEEMELIRVYQSSSFLVQTSRYETFGTVVIEALACGLPVVSTNTGIAPAVINKNNGILIQQSDVDQIVNAVEQMLVNYPTFEIDKLHESVAGMFSEEKISEELTSIYHEIICACQKD